MDEGSFKTVCIVGVGLIGGSLGLALKRAGLCEQVIGLGRRRESLQKALEKGAVDQFTLSPQEAFSQADLIILATPPSTIPTFFPLIGEGGKKGCLVSDVGSVKGRIIKEAEKLLPPHISFIGGHPLAGREKRGVEWARADLFQDTIYILTPSSRSTEEGMGKMKRLVETIGGYPLIMEADRHDLLLAYTSHFPHILAFSLCLLLKRIRDKDERVEHLAASGFRSMTRIAKSAADMWEDILLENRDNLLKVWENWEEVMEEMKKGLEEGNLKEKLEEAREVREKLDEIALSEDK